MANITEGIRSMVDKNSFRRWPENDVLNRIFTTLNGARLKAADTLLKTTDKTVSEIAYEVGFGTPSYFSKCYKELFGRHPGEGR